MKVSELIERLRGADPDCEVLVAPTRALPSMTLGSDPVEGVIRAADPFTRYAIEGVSLIGDLTTEPRTDSIVITFHRDIQEDDDGPAN